MSEVVVGLIGVVGVLMISTVLGACAGAIVDEVDGRRHLTGTDVLAGAVGVLVFVLSLVAGVWVLFG